MLDLLTHLYTAYAIISNVDWLENDKRFRKPYSPSVPIKVAWRKIDDDVAYSNAGSTPYSRKQVTDNAYQLVFNPGIFTEDCQEWIQRTAGNKTLTYLKTFFAAAHREWHLLLQYETGTPYGFAHNTTARPDDGYLQQETVDAIANPETDTASDCTDIAQLTATVERLTAELVTVNTKLVAALQTQRASQGGNGKQSRRRGRGRRASAGAGAGAGAGATTPTHGPPTGVGATTRTDKQDLEPPIHYCWACGPGFRHNSAKCSTLETGHVYMATKRDMQGGAEAQK